MGTAPPVARALVRIIHLLGSDGLSKSVKEHLVKVMRGNPNLDEKEEVMTFVYTMESDEVAKAATEKKDKINAVTNTIDCKVCLKKHKKHECTYKCCHCNMMGSHKSEKCFKAYPELKR